MGKKRSGMDQAQLMTAMSRNNTETTRNGSLKNEAPPTPNQDQRRRKSFAPADRRLTSPACSLACARHAQSDRDQRHPHTRRTSEQPEKHQPRHPVPEARRHHRTERFGQELARLRHTFRRGAAPLRRNVFALRAAVLRPDGQAGRRFHRGHSAGHRHRTAQRRPLHAFHRRHDDRGLRLHEGALALREHAPLREVRPARAQGQRADDLGEADEGGGVAGCRIQKAGWRRSRHRRCGSG